MDGWIFVWSTAKINISASDFSYKITDASVQWGQWLHRAEHWEHQWVPTGSSHCQGAGQAGGHWGHSQSHYIRQLLGDGDRLRPGWDISLEVQPSSVAAKVVRTGLGQSLEPASYSMAGAGTGGPGLSWNGVLGPWMGHGLRSQVRFLIGVTGEASQGC